VSRLTGAGPAGIEGDEGLLAAAILEGDVLAGKRTALDADGVVAAAVGRAGPAEPAQADVVEREVAIDVVVILRLVDAVGARMVI